MNNPSRPWLNILAFELLHINNPLKLTYNDMVKGVLDKLKLLNPLLLIFNNRQQPGEIYEQYCINILLHEKLLYPVAIPF